MQKNTKERTCQCGAIYTATSRRCQKCIARMRWIRRKAWRTSPEHRVGTQRAFAERSDVA
jgi:hypothetical protein